MSRRVGTYRLLQRRGGHVAVKMLPEASAGEASTLRKFLAEAHIGQNLKHQNIVDVHEASADGHRPYMVMELLHGRTLSQLPKEPLPVPLVVELACQALTALDHAHAFIVHRDIKPSNLFLTREGVLKVIDFGIAVWGDVERTRTATGVLRGSLPYSTPEQARNEAVDARSDLFSLGLVLHELLTGERVLNQANDAAIVTALVMSPAPRVSNLRADVPEPLDDAIARALERDRERRFPTARAMLDAIQTCPRWSQADVAAWLARQAAPAPVTTREGTESVRPAPPALAAGPTRRPALVLGVATLVFAVLAGGAWYRSQVTPVIVPAALPIAQVAPPLDAGPPAAEEEEQVEDEAPRPTVAPTAKRGSGWLTVDARPSWGTVYIDGKKLGPTPLYRQALPPGRHLVEVEKQDGTRKKKKVIVAPGREQTVVITW